MHRQHYGRRLLATDSGPRPGDFPIGSPESRAAARSMLSTIASQECICFPPNEPPFLELKAEIEAARAVRCPIHGERSNRLAPGTYRARQFPQHLDPAWRTWHSSQYIKAMDASFPPDRWPTTGVVEPDGSTRFLLKDGTEIYREPPHEPVYDYVSREIIGVLEGYPPKFRSR